MVKARARGSCLAVRLARLTARRCVSTSTRRIWYAAVAEVALLPTCADVASKWARQCKAVTTKELERPGWLRSGETPTSAEAQKESQQEEVGRQQSEVTEESGFDCSHVADTLRCLYLFSGKRRVGHLRECLAASLKSSKATLVMREIDAVRGRRTRTFVGEVAECAHGGGGCWEVRFGVASPPCSTFSWARSASVSGPPPLRSRLHPRGFPWLSKLARAQVASSNRLVDFTIKLLEAQVANGPKHMVVLEHPEDLGRRQNGAAPASIWQWPAVQALEAKMGVFSWALYQCDFGAV